MPVLKIFFKEKHCDGAFTGTTKNNLSAIHVLKARYITYYPSSRAVNMAVNTGVILDNRVHGP